MASKKKLTKAQKDKRSFRASSVWRDFRHKKNVEQGGLDFVTLKKLTKAFHCHHCDLNAEEYSNLENEGNFIAVNPETHKCLHWMLRYIKSYKSLEILDRFYAEVVRESKLNNYIDEDEES